MKINRINTYILVWLLTSRIRNLPVPVKGNVEAGNGGVTTPAPGATDSGSKTGVELSLKGKKATDQFDRTENNKVVTFTAKDNYAFKSVKTGDKLVWEAKDKKYADSVTLYGKGKKEKIVTINIPNGNNMAYVRDGKGKPWQEYDLSKAIPVCINVLNTTDTFAYTYKIENGVETFTPKEGFVFNKVMYTLGTDKTMWKTDKESEYANKVELEESKRAKIHLEDGSEIVFTFTNSRWQKNTQASTQKSGTDGSVRGTTTTPTSGGTTGTDPSGGGGSTHQSTPPTQ